MILRRIRVRNIRSYEIGEVDVPEGIVAFSGEIGAGKSSLLHAVEMALFGFAEVNPGHLLRHGANEGEVEVVLEDEGKTLSLRRKITRRFSGGEETSPRQECSFSQDGRVLTYSTTEMKRKAIELLGFPDNPNPRTQSDLWRWAVYVPQEKMREVLGGAGNRLEAIRKAHGLEEYRLARENAEPVKSELRAQERVLQGEARTHIENSRGLEEALKRKGEAEARLAALHVEFKALATIVEGFRTDLATSQGLRKDLDVIRERQRGTAEKEVAAGRRIELKMAERQKVLQEIVTLREDVSRMEKEMATISITEEEVTGKRREVEALRTRREAAQQRKEEYLKSVERKEAQEASLKSLNEEISSKRQDIADRRVQKEELEREAGTAPPITRIAETAGELDSEVSAQHERLTDLKETKGKFTASEEDLRQLVKSGKCPRCGQNVDSGMFKSHLKEAEAKRVRIATEAKEVEKRIGELTEKRKARMVHDKDILRWENSRRLVHAKEEELARRRKELKGLEKRLESLGEALKETVAILSGLEGSVEESDKATGEETKASRALDAARKRIEERRSGEARIALNREKTRQSEERVVRIENDITGSQEEKEGALLEGGRLSVEAARLEGETKRFSGLKERSEMAEKDLEFKSKEVIAKESDLGHLRADISRMEEALRKSREAEAKARTCDEIVEWLKVFQDACEEIERRRLDGIRTEFLREFVRYFSILVEDDGMRATMDDVFNPSVETGGFPIPAEAMSGGERTALALSYRLALGQTVRSANRLRMETLILDEPTEGFSAEQVTKLSELLRDLEKRQILLVSHEGNLTGIADHVVQVEKKDGKSVVAVVGHFGSAPRRAPAVQAPLPS